MLNVLVNFGCNVKAGSRAERSRFVSSVSDSEEDIAKFKLKHEFHLRRLVSVSHLSLLTHKEMNLINF